jgi:hypothetical protein
MASVQSVSRKTSEHGVKKILMENVSENRLLHRIIRVSQKSGREFKKSFSTHQK